MIGSLRAGYVFISAGVAMIMAVIGTALMANSFNLVNIVEAQSNIWFVFPQILGFIVFLVAFLMEVERVPFDIPVAEQEIVLGWKTEYTGINFGLTMMAEYVAICSWSLLMVTLYFGGYHGPQIFPIMIVSNIFWVIVKFAIVVAVLMLLRSVFPRLRLDQTLKLSWHFLIPLALINLLISAWLSYFGPLLGWW